MLKRLCAASVGCGALCHPARAGELDPPAPPASTAPVTDARTPIGPETTPGAASAVFVISEPGSYYLTGDVAGEPGRRGIDIDAHSVDLDLNGFSVLGVPDTLQGIRVTSEFAVRGLRIHGGVVHGWGSSGIALGNADAPAVTDVRVSRNLLGLSGSSDLTGPQVLRCQAISNENGGFAMSSGDNSLVRDSIARDNGGVGIRVGRGSVVTDCVAAENVTGISTQAYCVVSVCAAEENSGTGMSISGSSTVENSIAADNGGLGFSLSVGAAAIDCTAPGNGSHGFQLFRASTVRGCTAAFNGDAGFFVNQPGTRCRVEGNSAVSNGSFGFDINGGDNLIVGNSTSDNTSGSYSVAAGNTVGPFVTFVTIGSNTNPSANYRH